MNTADIRLRSDWRAGDRERIVDLHARGYLDYDRRFSAGHIAELTTAVGGMIDEAGMGDDSEHRAWFAERILDTGEIETLGCVALLRRGQRGQLRWLIVLPEARGIGLGWQLVEAVLHRARLLVLDDVFLLTAPDLPESMALYRRFGFETVRETVARQWHGQGHDIEMVKPL